MEAVQRGDRYPQDKVEADQAEKALAKELAKLSLQERELILHDIHGVREESVDAATIQEKLEELQGELSVLITNNKAGAYERALSLDRHFVEDKCFRKWFLSADDWNPVKAAQRLALHFEVKRELFLRNPGEDGVLVREVTWDDLEELDREIVNSGVLQFGSRRDVAGRLVMFITPKLFHPNWEHENMCRACWYMYMSALRTDGEMGTKGIVIVFMNFAKQFPSMQKLQRIARMRASLPFATVAHHQCYDNQAHYLGILGYRLLLFATNAPDSFRTRIHHGPVQHIALELQTFGIPLVSCPWYDEPKNDDSTTTRKQSSPVSWHHEWLSAIRDDEKKLKDDKVIADLQSSNNPENVCIIPRRFDVLFGRTKLAREHPGTLRCHHLIQTHWDAYEKADRRGKTKVTDQIIALIQESEGRFLQLADSAATSSHATSTTTTSEGNEGGGRWVIVDNKVARYKISHIFRYIRGVEEHKAWQARAMQDGKMQGDVLGQKQGAEDPATLSQMRTKKQPFLGTVPTETVENHRKHRRVDS